MRLTKIACSGSMVVLLMAQAIRGAADANLADAVERRDVPGVSHIAVTKSGSECRAI